jgi:phage terminase large subunit GpA-like protein
MQLWHLDSDYLKSWVHGRIRWPVGEVGAWHLYQDTDEDYCRQVVAEQLLIKPSGRRVWLVKNRSNHYLDAETNALAAALTLQIQSLRQLPSELTINTLTPPVSKPQSQFVRNARGLF